MDRDSRDQSLGKTENILMFISKLKNTEFIQEQTCGMIQSAFDCVSDRSIRAILQVSDIVWTACVRVETLEAKLEVWVIFVQWSIELQ